ncbi:MAG: hypothetical protein JWP87_1944 [Labilithrix sp.]|nr:hypothetical protein [Labilithrix sp.]
MGWMEWRWGRLPCCLLETSAYERSMAITLNLQALEQAKRLIREGRYVVDERDAWSEHQPSAERENDYLLEQGWEDYGKWYLGIDRAEHTEVKAKYKFPYGDVAMVHRCGLLSAESRAGQYKYADIEKAAHELHDMIDAGRRERASR